MKAYLVVMVIGASACGGSDPVSIDNYSEEYTDAICTQFVRCEIVESVGTCKDVLRFFDTTLLTLVDAVKIGRIEYSADAAGECFDELRDYDCVFPGYHASTSCDDVFRGTVPEGGACFVAAECADFATCTLNDPNCNATTTCCPGTCGAPRRTVMKGQSCDELDRCEDGTYCKPAASGTGSGTCSAWATEGAACDELDSCVNPLVCSGSAGVRTCVRPAGSGETCDPARSTECADSRQHCDPTTLKCVDALPAGAACERHEECSAHASCVDGTCQDDLAEGAACTTDGPDCGGLAECVDGTCQVEPRSPAMSCY
jgi:hypothetical protein